MPNDFHFAALLYLCSEPVGCPPANEVETPGFETWPSWTDRGHRTGLRVERNRARPELKGHRLRTLGPNGAAVPPWRQTETN